MADFYLVLTRNWLAPDLLASMPKQLRQQFRFLSSKDAIGEFLKKSVREVDHPQAADYEWNRIASKVAWSNSRPFIHGLGPLVLLRSALIFRRDIFQDKICEIWPTNTPQRPYRDPERRRFGLPSNGDQSIGHIPWSVQFLHRIVLHQDSTQKLASLLQTTKLPTTNMRCQIRIYPYGLVVLSCSIAVSTQSEITRNELGQALQWLAGKPQANPDKPVFKMPGKNWKGTFDDLAAFVVNRLSHSIFEDANRAKLLAGVGFPAVHLRGSNPPVADRESFLLFRQFVGEQKPEMLRVSADDMETIFGKYSTDRILLSRGGLFVETDGQEWSQSSSDRKFFGRLLLVVELELGQKVLFEYLDDQFREELLRPPEVKESIKSRLKNYTKSTLVESRNLRLIRNLLTAESHLPAPYSKWYEISSKRLGIEEVCGRLENTAKELLESAEKWERPLIEDLKGLRELLLSMPKSS